jgi:diguanylate cyclase (GGDEF)-like protein
MALSKNFAWRQFAMPAVVFCIGVALSIGLALIDRHEIDAAAQQRFDATAITAARKVEDRFDAYTEVLIGLRALFHTSADVSPAQFKHYVDALNLDANYPGFQTLNYAAFTPASAAVDADENQRRERHIVRLLEPQAGNEGTLGRDLGSIPAAQKALERARDTGELTSSGRKIQIKGAHADIGLAVRMPVYRAGMPQDTVEERRAAYLGSVGAGFRLSELMRGVTLDGGRGARVRLHDGGPRGPHAPGEVDNADVRLVSSTTELAESSLLFDTLPGIALPKDRFERRLGFELGGHSWLLHVSQDGAQVVGSLDRAMPWLVLLCGLAISALLAGIVHSLTTSRSRAEGIAHDMTRHLRTSERRLDEAQRLANLGSWLLDPRDGSVQCSSEAMRIFGFGLDVTQIDVATMLSRVPADERATVERHIANAASSRRRAEFEHRLCLPDGTERWVHAIVQWTEEAGKTALRGTVRDDTQRHKVAQRLQLEHRVAQLLGADGEHADVMSRALQALCTQLGWECGTIWSVRDDGVVRQSASWHAEHEGLVHEFMHISQSLSYRPDEGSLGRAWVAGESIVVDTSAGQDQFTRDALAGQAGLCSGLVVPMVAARRATALELFSRTPRRHDAETVESLRAITLQITQYEERKEAERSLRYMASHDALTGLSNRNTLQRDMARAIKRSIRHQKRFAVMFVDLDRFKRINDTLGHGVGDALIKACGERLTAVLREDDAVARFGGDEFVLIAENLSKPTDAAIVAEKVLACCAEPFVIGGHELHVSASIGVAVYPEDGADGEALLKNADTAMYRAKDKGRGAYQFYTAQMNAQGTERLMLESGLRRAIERGELELHYQPKMNLHTQRIAGVEALMRWRHPVLGLVSPAQFIPIAEETGLIVEMGKWALHTACTDARDWQQRGLPAVQMSVNLSPRQLSSPTLLDDIDEVLNRSGLNPELLELEITEGAMMNNPDQAAALLRDIRAKGVGLAIDDFGTGYSSLSYLKRFPLTTVKIDRSFVNDLSQDRDAEALSDGIVTLAHGLRMKVVAEGVETAEQLAYLRAHGCDEIQGFWLCKPLPAQALCDFMARHLRTQFAAPVAA